MYIGALIVGRLAQRINPKAVVSNKASILLEHRLCPEENRGLIMDMYVVMYVFKASTNIAEGLLHSLILYHT